MADTLAPQRDARGRFLPGWQGGPGRPARATEEKYMSILFDNVSEDDWRVIITRAVKDARDGDHRAREWLSEYLLGRPRQQVDITAEAAETNLALLLTSVRSALLEESDEL